MIREVPDAPPPERLLGHLAAARDPFWLDGAFDPADEGARSYLGLDAIEIVAPDGPDALGALCRALETWTDRRAEGPGGGAPAPRAVGFLSYEAGRFVERVPLAPGPSLSPDVRFAIHDAVYVFDHATGRAWIEADDARAADRLADRLAATPPQIGAPPAVAGPVSNLSVGSFHEMVRAALELIAAGEVYQVNLAQRFRAKVRGDDGALGLYQALREASPAPFGALVPHGDGWVLSLSPERLLRFDPVSREVETRPIKGTRPRGADADEDARLADELAADAKERAEHLMIVDLERNDLGRIAEPGSVTVDGFRRVRTLPRVHHLVSTVRARARPDVRLEDVLRATFPGGSITGAPKVRAMEVIAALEPERRGVYTGAVGHVDRRGGCDLAVAIRTAVLRAGELSFHVGGGIVADSDPERERRETLTKAETFRGIAAPLPG